jgi:hypothetical protein
LVPYLDFFINWVPESPRVGLPKTSKQSLPVFTPSISGKTRGDGVKWLWYLDSASLNYPRTDTLVPAIELAEICVKDEKKMKHLREKWKRKLFGKIVSCLKFFFQQTIPF